MATSQVLFALDGESDMVVENLLLLSWWLTPGGVARSGI